MPLQAKLKQGDAFFPQVHNHTNKTGTYWYADFFYEHFPTSVIQSTKKQFGYDQPSGSQHYLILTWNTFFLFKSEAKINLSLKDGVTTHL